MKDSLNTPTPPTVYIVAGPNGAGKTTFATEFLPAFADCREFLNADLIAAGLSPFSPESQSLRAARLLLTRMDELTAKRQDFGFEIDLGRPGLCAAVGGDETPGLSSRVIFLMVANP